MFIHHQPLNIVQDWRAFNKAAIWYWSKLIFELHTIRMKQIKFLSEDHLVIVPSLLIIFGFWFLFPGGHTRISVWRRSTSSLGYIRSLSLYYKISFARYRYVYKLATSTNPYVRYCRKNTGETSRKVSWSIPEAPITCRREHLVVNKLA